MFRLLGRISSGGLVLLLIALVSSSFAAAEDGWISGKVCEEEYFLGMTLAGDPIAGATVRVGGTGQSVQTNSTGKFNFSLPEGRYTLSASALGFDGRTCSSIAVVANRTTRCDINLSRPSGNLTGIITDIDTGGPVEDVWVTMVSENISSIAMNSTDAAGRYTLRHLPPGMVNISVISLSLSGKLYEPTNFSVMIVAGTTVTHNLRIGTPCYLKITVRDSNSNPIEGATVKCGSAQNRTGADGVTVLDVRPGHYTLEISGPGLTTARHDVDLVAGKNEYEAGMARSPIPGTDPLTICITMFVLIIVLVAIIIFLIVRMRKRKGAQPAYAGPSAQYTGMYYSGQQPQPWPPGGYYPPPASPPPTEPPGPGYPPPAP